MRDYKENRHDYSHNKQDLHKNCTKITGISVLTTIISNTIQ